jgi:hypothetical protein
MGAPAQEALLMDVKPAQPDPRDPIDRRQRDGLGLLPRARTTQERQHRARANRAGAFTLIVFGSLVFLASLVLVFLHPASLAWLGVLSGSLILLQGVSLAGRRERRQADRRHRKAT